MVAKAARVVNGAGTITFSEFGIIDLDQGDDNATGSGAQDAHVDLGSGADTIDAGGGGDTYDLGRTGASADGDADVVVFSDGDGKDTLS